jgi:DNA end-binding protein Ku
MRSIWSGSISFGLLNIPITVRSSKEDKELHFTMLDEKDMAPIHFKRVNSKTGKEVPYDRIVKGYEFKKGKYVTFTDKDFKAANPKAAHTVDIEDFVELKEIDPLMFDKPYYLIPQKDAEKGYFLLRDALNKTKKVAIAKIVMHGKQHLVAIMPREKYLILEILRFGHEVKEVHEVDFLKDVNTKVKYSPRELKVAEELINDMTADWNADKYHDTYYDEVMDRIKAKIKAGAGAELEEPEVEEENEDATNVVDLLPLLRESLAAKHKKSSRKTTSHAKEH